MNGEPAGPVRVRRDIRSLLADGDRGRKVIEDYARAVTIMRALDPSDGPPTNPLSWRYQAAIHGTTASPPAGSSWKTCHHNGWYFLPWHRAYLWRFEQIVQHHLGDPTWSLPYWDYVCADDDDARRLPAPFVSDTTSSLYTVERMPERNRPNGLPLRAELFSESLKMLRRVVFSGDPDEEVDVTFGGEETGQSPMGGGRNARGGIENWPHGPVHIDVGGIENGLPKGWMAAFETAALDPLFWLHHANIDRLWEVWRNLGHDVPIATAKWMQHEFFFFDAQRARRPTKVREVIDTVQLGYRYESTAPPPGFAAEPSTSGRGVQLSAGGAEMAKPQLVGAVSDVSMSSPTTVPVRLEPPLPDRGSRAAALEDDETEGPKERWLLRIENMVATRLPATVVGVYLNLPEGAALEDHPERRAGLVSMFGILEATAAEGLHAGGGLTEVFDITDVVDHLSVQGEWTPNAVRVTVAPIDDYGKATSGGDLRAGRVSIYRG